MEKERESTGNRGIKRGKSCCFAAAVTAGLPHARIPCHHRQCLPALPALHLILSPVHRAYEVTAELQRHCPASSRRVTVVTVTVTRKGERAETARPREKGGCSSRCQTFIATFLSPPLPRVVEESVSVIKGGVHRPSWHQRKLLLLDVR
ncbi:hypothetical protein AAHE18_01G107700 [Arachis hypogaea]